MASINYAYLCDYAFMNNGKLSLLGICETIQTDKVPVIHPQLFMAVHYTIYPNDGLMNLAVQISSPGGSAIGRVEEPPISIQSGVKSHKTIYRFYSLLLEETGEYHAEIFLNGQSVHFVPLIVNLI